MQTETTRVEAFSDGMFAIAITLLILEVKVPSLAQGSLAAGLLQQWPSYLAFFLSFAYIGIMWMNHHRMFTHIRRSNDTLLVLNLLLLLGVTAVPFPTAVLASRLGTPDQRTAAVFYNAVFTVIAVFFNVLWRYAVSRQLLDKSLAHSAAMISRQYAVGPFIYGLCLALAWVDVRVSIGVNVAVALFFALPPSLMKRANGNQHTATSQSG
ncbi:MAG TPA: TMEM175 family protein [Candidatus Angelobacter sp.]|nr:TMEM175 family protein [Candidatus Angelobacter sp.]